MKYSNKCSNIEKGAKFCLWQHSSYLFKGSSSELGYTEYL
jgi:hypothetical protein